MPLVTTSASSLARIFRREADIRRDVPFDAHRRPDWKSDLREVAAYYDLRPALMRRRASRHRADVTEARQALMHRLVVVRGYRDVVVGRWLDCSVQTVRDGVAAHMQRIADHHETNAPQGAEPAQHGGAS